MSAPASAHRTSVDSPTAGQHDAGQHEAGQHEATQPDWVGDDAPTRGETLRVLLFAAIGPLVAGYLAVAALLALVVALAPGSAISIGGILAATGPVWLAAMHVQLIITGHPLGALPLLPTILLGALAAQAAMRAADRLGARTPASSRPIFLAIGLGHGAFAVLLSTVGSGSEVSSSPVLAFVLAAALGCVGTAIGLARRCGLTTVVLARADEPTRSGIRAGLLGLVALLAAGAVLLGLALLLSWSTVAGMFADGAPGFGAGLGMIMLSLVYLPNALIGALSFAVGPGFSLGALVVRPLAFHPGPVLGLPLLGAVPARSAPWWLMVFLLPAAVGVAVGWACRCVTDPAPARSRRHQSAEQPPDRALGRLRAVGVAALTVALGCLAMAALAGGTIADGPFNPASVEAGLLALTAFGWIAIVGAITALVAGPHPQALTALATRMADALTDPVDEDTADNDAHQHDQEDQEDQEDQATTPTSDHPVADEIEEIEEYDAEDHAQPNEPNSPDLDEPSDSNKPADPDTAADDGSSPMR